MSKNTIEENQRRHQLDDDEQVWLFGYGSLIYLVDFPYLESRPASIRGWSRRFWQGSHDHRGTEENPGRVVTLIEDKDAVCGGIKAKRLTVEEGDGFLIEAPVFRQLDVREKNGYLRVTTEMIFDDDSHATGLTYIATPDNEAYLGAASEYQIARHISRAAGPSGPNDEYLLELANALRSLGLHDQHVFDIESHLLRMTR